MRVGKNSGPVLSRLWTKVHEILRQRTRPFVLSKPLPDCLCHVSFSRYSPLSLEVVEKPNKCKSFLAPNFFRAGRPQLFYGIRILLARPTVHRLTTCGWVSFADLLSAKPGNEVECGIYGGWENYDPIWSRLWTKVHVVLRQCSRPLVVCNELWIHHNNPSLLVFHSSLNTWQFIPLVSTLHGQFRYPWTAFTTFWPYVACSCFSSGG